MERLHGRCTRRAVRGHPVHLLLIALVLVGILLPASVRAQTPVVEITLGTSTEGRPIDGVRIGSGARKLVLIGSVHGGPERNTFTLVSELVRHYRAHPEEVPAGVRLYLFPSFNPDGLALNVRQNANGVDLNRNMDTAADACEENDWRSTVEGAYGIVSETGGPYPESELESRLLRDFLLDAHGVIFFHTSGAVVFPACNSPASTELGRVFAAGAGYSFVQAWDRYTITGGMHDWAGGLGIAAITPELRTADQAETAANLEGVRAVLEAAPRLLRPARAHRVGGVRVQPIIWRAWTAWGGERIFGLPIGPPMRTADGWRQPFASAVLRYTPGLSDTTQVVRLEPLGYLSLGSAQQGDASESAAEPDVDDLLASFWNRHGGAALLGKPVAAVERTVDDPGRPNVRQVFERVVLERPAEATGVQDVQLAPLGRLELARLDAQSPLSAVRAR